MKYTDLENEWLIQWFQFILDNPDKDWCWRSICCNEKKIIKSYQFNTYHTFVIQVKNRKKLVSYLGRKGINTAVHYPIPIHLQPAAKFLGYKKGSFPIVEKQANEILTLPIHQNLKRKDLIRIIKTVNNFFN